MDLSWIVGAIALAVVIAWYVSYGAARLDRLHTRVEGALSVLDAQLVRRAEATLELANCGALDASSSLILAGAATDSLEADATDLGSREAIESDLTQALELALGDETLRRLREDEAVGAPVLQRVAAANQRVELARRFLLRGRWLDLQHRQNGSLSNGSLGFGSLRKNRLGARMPRRSAGKLLVSGTQQRRCAESEHQYRHRQHDRGEQKTKAREHERQFRLRGIVCEGLESKGTR